jgi:serine phosphatase RsbU (regulator of sigma subunit)
MILSIRAKIILITLLILFLGIGASTILNGYLFISEHFTVLQANTYTIAQNLKFQLDKIIRLGLTLDTMMGFEKQCKEVVAKYKNIAYAMVIKENGEIVFHNDSNEMGMTLQGPSKQVLDKLSGTEQIYHTSKHKDNEYYEVLIPVEDNQKMIIGAIAIGFPVNIIQQKIYALVFSTALTTIVSFIIALMLLIFALYLWVTRPLAQLVTVIQDIREKNSLDRHVEIKSQDEIGKLASVFNKMISELDHNRMALIEKKRIEKELEIARVIQSTILPKDIRLPGYLVAASMRPAEEVGGDYYDIINKNDVYWVNIGDVTGHGVAAGLVMMMLQTCALANINANPNIPPNTLTSLSNKTLFQNVKKRMLLDMYVTTCFLKFNEEGQFEYAGAHLPILIYRNKTKKVEQFQTEGVWLGMFEDITNITHNKSFQLGKDDLLFLYTDGVIEVRNPQKELYGLERLTNLLIRNGEKTPDEVMDSLYKELESFMHEQSDDITVVIVKKQ